MRLATIFVSMLFVGSASASTADAISNANQLMQKYTGDVPGADPFRRQTVTSIQINRSHRFMVVFPGKSQWMRRLEASRSGMQVCAAA